MQFTGQIRVGSSEAERLIVNQRAEISKFSLPSKVSAVRNKCAQSIVAKNIGAEDTNKGRKSHPPYAS